MRVLVLGGSGFVGRVTAETAVARGWSVTVANRGRSGPPPTGADHVTIDRLDPASADRLTDGHWDAVVDTWSGAPAAVQRTAAALADRADFYGYVSSRSVYRWPIPLGADESAPVVDADPKAGPDDEPGYAEAKRGGELAVLDAFAGRSVIARAGLILGPHEDTGRLTWWLRRVEAGGDVVAPEPTDRVWQYVDARDLAEFVLDAAVDSRSGVFNVVCPRESGTTTERLLDACLAAVGGRARLRWVPLDVLGEAGIRGWEDLPGWAPPTGELAGMHDCDVSAALAAGLSCRPIEETVADTWSWLSTRDDPSLPLRDGLPGRRGLSAEQEQQIWWLLGGGNSR